MSVSKRALIYHLHDRGYSPCDEIFSQEVRILVFDFLEKDRENVSEGLSKEIEDFVKYFKTRTKHFYVTCNWKFDAMMIKHAGFFDLPKFFKNFNCPDPPRPKRKMVSNKF
jgi:hypothetical protein